jgi:hypothetical protein
MSDTKNSGPQAQHPEPHGPRDKKAKMAPRSDAPPGLEQDGCGNIIPLAQRTEEDQQKSIGASRGGQNKERRRKPERP